MKYKELDKELRSITMAEIKPNVSAIARKYGISRGMVRRHIAEIDVKQPAKKRKRRECELLKYDEEIKEMLGKGTLTLKAIYMYLVMVVVGNKKIGSYSNFKQYIACHYKDLYKSSKQTVAAYRYETAPGEQMQFDWIENMQTKLSDGTNVEYNIWSATLGYSRAHIYAVALHKNEAALRRCFIDTCIKINGVPEKVLTDNMSAIVSIQGNHKYVHPSVTQFFKDMGTKLELCKIKTPKTKGKVEVSNKYQSWLKPYDGKFTTKEDLFKAIPQILDACNYQANKTTGIAPQVLFKKEKEHLKTLPPMEILRCYYSSFSQKQVDKSCLIHYNGASYGVPSKYCNTKMLLMEEDKQIYLYSEDLKEYIIYPKYTKGIHYAKGLYSIAKYKTESEEAYNERVQTNLNRLANIGVIAKAGGNYELSI